MRCTVELSPQFMKCVPGSSAIIFHNYHGFCKVLSEFKDILISFFFLSIKVLITRGMHQPAIITTGLSTVPSMTRLACLTNGSSGLFWESTCSPKAHLAIPSIVNASNTLWKKYGVSMHYPAVDFVSFSQFNSNTNNHPQTWQLRHYKSYMTVTCNTKPTPRRLQTDCFLATGVIDLFCWVCNRSNVGLVSMIWN